MSKQSIAQLSSTLQSRLSGVARSVEAMLHSY